MMTINNKNGRNNWGTCLALPVTINYGPGMNPQTFISLLTLEAALLDFSKKKLSVILHLRIINYLFLIFLCILCWDTVDRNQFLLINNCYNLFNARPHSPRSTPSPLPPPKKYITLAQNSRVPASPRLLSWIYELPQKLISIFLICNPCVLHLHITCKYRKAHNNYIPGP